MASPQKENGYTAIANELLEALCVRIMRGEARAVYDAIIRKTYGFQKKEDHLPLSQLSKITGLPSSEVCRSLRYLKEMKVILRDDNGLTRIQKDYEKWLLAIRPVAIVPVARLPMATGMGATGATGMGATLKRKGQKKGIKRNLPKGKEPTAPAFSKKEIQSFFLPTEAMSENQLEDDGFPRRRKFGDEAMNWLLDYFEFRFQRELEGTDAQNKRFLIHLKRVLGFGRVREMVDWASDPDCWWHDKINGYGKIWYKRSVLLNQMENEAKRPKGVLNLDEIK